MLCALMRAIRKRPPAHLIVKASLAVLMTVLAPMQVCAQSHPVSASSALPAGGQVAAGNASIQQGDTATNPVLTIQQGSARAIINWNSFDIGQNAKVDFIQPDRQSVALNRVPHQKPLPDTAFPAINNLSPERGIGITNATSLFYHRLEKSISRIQYV